MMKKYILYNPLACNGHGEEAAHKLNDLYRCDTAVRLFRVPV